MRAWVVRAMNTRLNEGEDVGACVQERTCGTCEVQVERVKLHE